MTARRHKENKQTPSISVESAAEELGNVFVSFCDEYPDTGSLLILSLYGQAVSQLQDLIESGRHPGINWKSPRAELTYNSDLSPEALIEQARGHVWFIEASDGELEHINETYPVIATVPSERGWEVQIVADSLDGFQGKPVEPNLEHAYVYFMENTPGQSWKEN